MFINYVTAAAVDVTKPGDRKGINAHDIFKAMAALDFEHFLPMIRVAVQGIYVQYFRMFWPRSNLSSEFQQKAKEKRQEYKRNFKERHRQSLAADGTKSADENEDGDEGDVGEGNEGDESMTLDEPQDPEMKNEEDISLPQKRRSSLDEEEEASKRLRLSAHPEVQNGYHITDNAASNPNLSTGNTYDGETGSNGNHNGMNSG